MLHAGYAYALQGIVATCVVLDKGSLWSQLLVVESLSAVTECTGRPVSPLPPVWVLIPNTFDPKLREGIKKKTVMNRSG